MSYAVAHDHSGLTFLVFEGDPAWELCQKLLQRGVREIVLPRETLVTGRLVSVSTPSSLAKWNVSKPEIAEMLRRYVRLKDCEWYLRGSNRSNPEVPVRGASAVGTSEDHASG